MRNQLPTLVQTLIKSRIDREQGSMEAMGHDAFT